MRAPVWAKNDDFQLYNHRPRPRASRISPAAKYEKCLISKPKAVYIARQENEKPMNSLGFDKEPKDTRPHAAHAKMINDAETQKQDDEFARI